MGIKFFNSTFGKLTTLVTFFQKSRAEAILEKSRQNKASANTCQDNYGSGTTDVLEKAKAWNLDIWSLNKLFTWLEKFKSKARLPLKRMYQIYSVNCGVIYSQPLPYKITSAIFQYQFQNA